MAQDREPEDPDKYGKTVTWGFVTPGLCGVGNVNSHLRSDPRERPAERVFGRRDGVGAVR